MNTTKAPQTPLILCNIRQQGEITVRCPQNSQERLQFHVDESGVNFNRLRGRHESQQEFPELLRLVGPLAEVSRGRQLIALQLKTRLKAQIGFRLT